MTQSPHSHSVHPHGHGHDHGAHGPGHVHAPDRFGKAFFLGILLNTGFVVVEVIYGVLAHSVALVADAGHNLSDVLGLAIAWFAASLGRRPPSSRFTYGLGGSSILAALFNAVLLLVAVGAVAWEAIGRLQRPEPVSTTTVMVVAGVGILINSVTALLFMAGRKGDLNIRGAFLHMTADAAVSAGVVIAGLVMLLTGKLWIDPAVSLGIVAVIIWGTWGLLRDSVKLSLAGVPGHIDIDKVREFLAGLPGAAAVHDLHIWPMSTTETALTAHLVMPAGHPGDGFLAEVASELQDRYRIGHSTLQVEVDADAACKLEPDHVV